MIGKINIFRSDSFENLYFPALDVKVKAGGYGSFESAALDFPEDIIDLTRLLIIAPKNKKNCKLNTYRGSYREEGILTLDNYTL